MNHETIYLIQESSSEYPIWSLARWIRRHDLSRFHVVKTIEAVPRIISVHDQQISIPTTQRLAMLPKHISLAYQRIAINGHESIMSKPSASSERKPKV